MQDSFSNLFHVNNHPPRSMNIFIPNYEHGRAAHLGHHRHHYFHHLIAPNLSIESCPETPVSDHDDQPLFSSSPKVWSTTPKADIASVSKNQLHKNSHHHHSIQELIRHFGKKMHHWRSEGSGRRNSCSESGVNDNDDQFRTRSKSLDCSVKRPEFSDCEGTYRIYEKILKEGNPST